MLLTAALILGGIWLAAVVIFKITKGLIHLALLIAIVAIVMHFIKAR